MNLYISAETLLSRYRQIVVLREKWWKGQASDRLGRDYFGLKQPPAEIGDDPAQGHEDHSDPRVRDSPGGITLKT